jgi:iron(III) transport system substrate-binding protein
MSQKKRFVLFSVIERELCSGLIDGFTQRHPEIELDYRSGISVPIHERYLAGVRSGQPEADLIWSSAMDLQMGIVQSGDALAYRSSEAADYPASAKYHDMAYATTVEPLLTVVNRDLFDIDLPAGSIGEIAGALKRDAAKLRGRVACCDIERNGVGCLALMYESRDLTSFSELTDALSICKPRAYPSNPEVIDEVSSGRAALGYHLLASFASRAVRENPALAIARTNIPSIAISRVAVIPKSAPHPEMAKLFVDYLLSREGQQQLQEAGLFPIKSMKASTGYANGVEPIPIAEVCDELLDPERRAWVVHQWRAAIDAASSISAT